MLPIELEDQIATPMQFGETVRILHRSCSLGKTAAMSVRRTNTGWVWYCFRCGYSGFKSSGNMSPSEVLRSMEKVEQPLQVVEHVSLPSDFLSMTEENRSAILPDAFGWLWKYHLSFPVLKKYGVGWSRHYGRIIFPVHNTPLLNETGATSLIGWFGRDPITRTKEERVKLVVPKWLTKRTRGVNFYFHIPSESKKVVIVEDVVSAIHVAESTRYQTLALGTTFFSPELMMRLKKFQIVVWLDGDMLAKSLNYVQKLQTFGISAYNISTNRDPKEFSSSNIVALVGENNERIDNAETVLRQ